MALAAWCRDRSRLRSHFGHGHSAGAYLALVSGFAVTPRPAARRISPGQDVPKGVIRTCTTTPPNPERRAGCLHRDRRKALRFGCAVHTLATVAVDGTLGTRGRAPELKLSVAQRQAVPNPSSDWRASQPHRHAVADAAARGGVQLGQTEPARAYATSPNACNFSCQSLKFSIAI